VLVVEEAKALVLNLKNPERVLTAIPTAKPHTIQGKPVVVTPHRLDEVKILNNLGIKAPSPIMHYYDWRGPFTPYDHQKETASFLTMHQRGLVLNEIGTGKTQSALWAADYLLQIGKVKKVLIISPLSTLERVWGDGIFTGLVNRKFVTLHGSSARRLKLLNTEADFYIINHDGFSIISEQANGMFDLVIVDEAAVLRNPSTTRFKVFRKWMDNNPETRLWLMTGTPTPNSPTDAWALAKLVNSPTCTKTFTAFRDQVMAKVGQWKFMPKPNSVDTVKNILTPAIRYNREDCFDLPTTVTQTREVELSKEQKKHYQQMLKHFITEMSENQEQGRITAVNEAVKIQKLVQIACGVAYDDEGQNIELDASPRVNLVKELIEEAGEKVILFVPLTGTLHMLKKHLEKHWTVGVVNGSVSTGKRNQIFHDFQHEKDPHVLIAHPGTMAHGLTLTSASTIIWYGPINQNEQYVQANGRVERIGKKHVSNVVHIQATKLERKMYDRLQNKQQLQGLLLELIQEETNER
jgi:SNF2 family DNA or RNA helicase